MVRSCRRTGSAGVGGSYPSAGSSVAARLRATSSVGSLRDEVVTVGQLVRLPVIGIRQAVVDGLERAGLRIVLRADIHLVTHGEG